MSDLISRQAAIDKIAHATFDVTICGRRGFIDYKKEFEKAFVTIRDKYIEALEDLLSAEPKIIHCGDCKYKDDGIDENGIQFLKCLNGRSYGGTRINDFCSWGERRTDELGITN